MNKRWRLAGLATLLAFGCVDSEPVGVEVQPQFDYEFIDWDVTGGGVFSGETAYSSSYPEWNGENPRYEAPAGAQYFCPDYFWGFVTISAGSDDYVMSGAFGKMMTLTPSPAGYPRARYSVPETEHWNTAGNKYIYGGHVDGTCFFINVKLQPMVGWWVGFFSAERYVGTYGSTGTPSGGSPIGGWAFKDTSSGFSNGDGYGSASAAINAWLDNGTCTAGWVIVVDDEVVCSG